MNEINFLNSLSEKKYISYYRWVKNSIIIFFCLLILISFVHIKQLLKINSLKEEKIVLEKKLINFEDIVKQKSNIKLSKEKTHKELLKLNKISSDYQRKLIYNFLTDIVNIIPDDIRLQDLEFDSKTGITLKGYSIAVHSVNEFVKKLINFIFVDDVKLEYIKYNEYKNDIDNHIKYIHEFFIKLRIKKEN